MGGGIEFFDRVGDQSGIQAILNALKWDADGLVAVVSQDAGNKEVLGVAFADRVAVELSLTTGLMHYYSRSRKKLWKKGEQSGHVQKLVEMRVDCDGDAIVAQVRQVKANCHLGFRSCFSYKLKKSKTGEWSVEVVGRKVFDPKDVYHNEKQQRRRTTDLYAEDAEEQTERTQSRSNGKEQTARNGRERKKNYKKVNELAGKRLQKGTIRCS